VLSAAVTQQRIGRLLAAGEPDVQPPPWSAFPQLWHGPARRGVVAAPAACHV